MVPCPMTPAAVCVSKVADRPHISITSFRIAHACHYFRRRRQDSGGRNLLQTSYEHNLVKNLTKKTIGSCRFDSSENFAIVQIP